MQKTYYKTPIGLAEITADETAILSVNIVREAENRKLEIGNRDLVDSALLQKCIRELDEYFAGTRKNFTVKLEARGTDFQQRVWQELAKIPFGVTASYADIARRVGSPRAVRAVGSANSKNPHWIIVPCHRVIASNGALSGYAGGLDRKKWLLEHESRLV